MVAKQPYGGGVTWGAKALSDPVCFKDVGIGFLQPHNLRWQNSCTTFGGTVTNPVATQQPPLQAFLGVAVGSLFQVLPLDIV